MDRWLHLQQHEEEKCGEIVPSDDVQSAWVSVQRAAARLQDAIETKLKAAGLPPLAWYSVLWSLERGGPQRPRDLGESLFLERYSVSRLLDRIEADGLIEKRECPEDARGHLISVTEAGKATRLKMWKIHGPAMAETMPVTDPDARKLKAALDKLG